MQDEKLILATKGYEGVSLAGQGAFARVYCVRDGKTGMLYACKVSERQEMLRRESKLLQQIKHALFPAYYGFWEEKELSFLLMEYIAGESLGDLLKRTGRLSEVQALEIAVKLAVGLCYLHELPEPIIFRDLKPENVMIGDKGRVTLLDFGSAGEVHCKGDVITGTPGYGAPEQWNDRTKVGPHSDVYALGQVLITMLCGEKPTGAQSAGGCMENCMEKLYTLEKQLRKKERLHKGVIRLIEECTKEAVAERIPNMRSVIQRLKPYVQSDTEAIAQAEKNAGLCYKKPSEYIYQQNIIKTSTI